MLGDAIASENDVKMLFSGTEEELEQPGDRPAEPQREDAGEDLEAGHLLPQWPQLLLAHDNQVNHQYLPILTIASTL